MKERYKVLAAIIALREFTVDDIAGATGVKQNTVSTILARERRLVDKIADEKTGRRGGKRKRYRIRPESVETLRSELAELYKDLPAPDDLRRQRSTQNDLKPPSLPLGLLAAEDTLLFRYPNSNDSKEKQRILNLAKLDYRKGLIESRKLFAANPKQETRTAIEGSLRRVNALQKFFELDLLAHSSMNNEAEEVSAEALRSRLSELSNSVSEAINGLSPVLSSVRQFPTSNRRQSENSPIPQHESYTAAKSLLDQASLETDANEKSSLLEQASKALEDVWNDNESRDTPLKTIAFIRYEQGRLRFLRNEYQTARMFFAGAREVFETSENCSDEVAKVDQHLAVLSVQEFQLTHPTAPAQVEIQTTFAALERIDTKSQANYPLINFLQDLLKKTITRMSNTERDLRRDLDEAKRKLQLAGIPRESSRHIPSMHFGDGVVVSRGRSSMAVGAAATGGIGYAQAQVCSTHEAMEIRRSVDLSAQNPLACTYVEEKSQDRSTYDIPPLMFDA